MEMSQQEFQTEMLTRMARIETAIRGDEESGIYGLAQISKHNTDQINNMIPKVAQNFVDCKDFHSQLSSLESDRNKVKGAMWLGGTAFFGGVVTFLYNLFKH